MPSHIDRGLFLENGPTLLAERDRQVRAAGHAYRLLSAARRPAKAAPEADQQSAAA